MRCIREEACTLSLVWRMLCHLRVDMSAPMIMTIVDRARLALGVWFNPYRTCTCVMHIVYVILPHPY